MAAAVAIWVLMNISAPTPSSLPSQDPALNPNQPNQRSPAPSITRGRLCGRIGSFLKPTRLPMTRITPRAAAPALMCTAVPPAKSMTPISKAQPPVPHTQCATGKYTIVAHSATNSAHAVNFTRSASAPLIRAGVMTANISWNTAKT